MSTSAFAHRNPPRSLWLQLVHRTGCLTRRARPLKLTSILYKSNRHSRGRQDAINFVAIALPSLRSLRHSHRRVSFTYYATSSAWRYATECHAFSYYAHKARRPAARVPSSKGQIPCIRTFRMSEREKPALQVRGRWFLFHLRSCA